jgi:hypothetical protein
MNMAQFKFINDIVWHSIETGSVFNVSVLANKCCRGHFLNGQKAYFEYREYFIERYGVEAWALVYSLFSGLYRRSDSRFLMVEDVFRHEENSLRRERELELRRQLGASYTSI